MKTIKKRGWMQESRRETCDEAKSEIALFMNPKSFKFLSHPFFLSLLFLINS